MKVKGSIIDRLFHSIFALFTSIIAIYAWCTQENISNILLIIGIFLLTILFILDTIFRQKEISDSIEQDNKINSLIQEVSKKPKLIFEINNLQLENEVLEIRQINNVFPINIVVKNIGNSGTGELQLFLKYASFLSFENTNRFWHFDTKGSRTLKGTEFDGIINQNTFIWQVNILPNNWLSTGDAQFRILQDIQLNKIPIRLQAYYGNDGYYEAIFYLRKNT